MSFPFPEAPSICLQGWHSLHMKSVFNAPASAAAVAAAGNGWYMLYNHRGRENPHFSAVPSTENTDRKHSNHFKLRDLSGLPEARQKKPDRQPVGQSVSRTGSHTSVLCCRALISHRDHQCPHTTLVKKGRRKAFLQVPSSEFRVRACKQEFLPINTVSS